MGRTLGPEPDREGGAMPLASQAESGAGRVMVLVARGVAILLWATSLQILLSERE